MATKQNMYRGKKEQIRKTKNEIKECVIGWKIDANGNKTIAIYRVDRANQIRDDVSNKQGQLQVLISGLDKNSPKLAEYQEALDLLNAFMELF